MKIKEYLKTQKSQTLKIRYEIWMEMKDHDLAEEPSYFISYKRYETENEFKEMLEQFGECKIAELEIAEFDYENQNTHTIEQRIYIEGVQNE